MRGYVDLYVGDRWDYLVDIATQRYVFNQTARHFANDGSYDLIGAAVELAARAFLGLAEELHTGHDQATDLVFRNTRIDVKGSPWTPGWEYLHLQYPAHHHTIAPVLVFGVVDRKRRWVRLAGYTYGVSVMQQPINRQRATPCREVPVAQLKPMWHMFGGLLPPEVNK